MYTLPAMVVAAGVAVVLSALVAGAPEAPDCPLPPTADAPVFCFRQEEGGEEPTGPGEDGETDDPSTKAKKDKRGFEGIALPLTSYNSDLGFGIGAVGGAYFYSPGYDPYRHALAMQIFFTTRGIRNHWLRYDGPDLIDGIRVEARAEYRREKFFPFYGLGNLSLPGFDAGNTEQKVISYDTLFPGGFLRLRNHPFGKDNTVETWLGLRYSRFKIRPYPGSVLEQVQPVGIGGGNNGQILLGFINDTRDYEPDPTSGGVEDMSFRISGSATVSDFNYWGVNLTERRFFPFTERLIFAQRLMLDAMFGEVPFFVLPDLGGLGTEGIGGLSSVRGVPRDRYVGNIKALSNSELRWYFMDFDLFKQKFKLGGVAFVDLGRVWQPDVEDGPWWRWHPGVGTGLRVVRRAAVARVDYAVATEGLRQAIYITFGHIF